MSSKQRVTILGSTGSIGTNTLDVIGHIPSDSKLLPSQQQNKSSAWQSSVLSSNRDLQ